MCGKERLGHPSIASSFPFGLLQEDSLLAYAYIYFCKERKKSRGIPNGYINAF